MRLLELHLKAFGPFTDHVLSLGSGTQRLVLVHGLNEAGKSSALRAITNLRFGIPTRTDDRFLHDYAQMRIGGVFADSHGQTYALMRRKGTGITLRFADFAKGGVELADAVPPAVARLLTGGLSVADYENMFGLDHQVLRKGGAALARGEGEIGAALFEASSGAGDVQKILGELDTAAKRFFMPAAHAKNGRINQALAEYKLQAEQYKTAQVKPARWESVARASQQARQALDAAKAECARCAGDLALLRELTAVAPILAALAHAESAAGALSAHPLLAENAASERAAAEAGLSDAAADITLLGQRIKALQEAVAQLKLDTPILTASQAVSRLDAASGAISQLFGQIAAADAEAAARTRALDTLAAQIAPGESAQAVLKAAPAAAAAAHISACLVTLEQAERALDQHRLNAPETPASGSTPAGAMPDAAAQTDLRLALAETNKSAAALEALTRLPTDISRAARLAARWLAEAGLPDEASARRVRPLLGAVIDEAAQAFIAWAGERAEKSRRIAATQDALRLCEKTVSGLLDQGHVPTHEDVRLARLARDKGWALVKAAHIDAGAQPPRAGDVQSFMQAFPQGQSLPDSFEDAMHTADSLMDSLAKDTDRVSRLEAARREQGNLLHDLQRQQSELDQVLARGKALEAQWQGTLDKAGLPVMPPAQVRDWQALVASAWAAFDDQQALRAEQGRLEALQAQLASKLRQALRSLDLQPVPEDAPLAMLLALGEDCIRQMQQRVQDEARAAGQALQLQRQLDAHAARSRELHRERDEALARFTTCLASLRLPADAGLAMAKARLGEFTALLAADAALQEIRAQQARLAASLAVYRDRASAIAAALDEPLPADLLMAAGRWAARLEQASQQQSQLALLHQQLAACEERLAAAQGKAVQHEATLARLRHAAGVAATAELPAAEELSAQRRQALRDAAAAANQLAQASNRGKDALVQLLDNRTPDALRAEALQCEQAAGQADEALEKARQLDEAARLELAGLDAQDKAASALEAMASAVATVRDTLPLHIRTRLAHGLLQEAVNRFKERSQAPMLKSASAFFAQMTDGQFEGLVNDDTHQPPVIAARRPGGALVGVEALSEGTRDQLYLALRLAALQLQRERGVDLPVVLDDVLMTSDDGRAGCILQALCRFSEQGQVIVFTHHHHLAELARRVLPPYALAVVELKRYKVAR